jgi:hypothetical protein
MTTSQMMKTGSVELFALLLSLANSENIDTIECVTAILESRGIKVSLEGFEG